MANQSRQPNVIVFFTDQQRWDTTGAHGNPLGLTPNFDRMASRGTHLYHSFTCQPVCGPARSVFQTGLYPTTTGCFRNKIPLPEGSRTLAHYFNDAGYQTGYIGKWHLADENPVPESGRGGYKYWLAANALESTSESYDAVVFDNDNERVKLPGYRVDALTDAAIRFIDKEQDNPFFLFLSFLEPHHQNHRDDYPSPDVYTEAYTGRWTPPDLTALGGNSAQNLGGYYGMVKRLDEALGRIFDAVKSLDLAEETIILFTSDHGCHFKTRNSEYKRSCHESSIRVPTAVIGPGFDSRGQIRELVSLIDIAPTLLDAAGIEVPAQMQGRSILPLLRRETEGWRDDVYVQISEDGIGRAIRTSRWKYAVASLEGAKDAPSTDIYEERYLYDLQADPYELTNLIGFESHRDVTAVLKERLLRRMVEAGEAPATINAAESKQSRQRRVSASEVRA
ncbi:sulfatase-like hydrolase/transferase [Paenibacillus solisilvae]|uniref:Sulfatase-like hydrolase/transferase n=1 Tax=Paenibacillus solisilvae TaxID=2486751 RepID=A0ABW0VV04_9BACL